MTASLYRQVGEQRRQLASHIEALEREAVPRRAAMSALLGAPGSLRHPPR